MDSLLPSGRLAESLYSLSRETAWLAVLIAVTGIAWVDCQYPAIGLAPLYLPVGLCALFGHRFTVATTTASVSGVVQSGWPSRRSIFVNRTGNILRSPLQKGRHDGRP